MADRTQAKGLEGSKSIARRNRGEIVRQRLWNTNVVQTESSTNASFGLGDGNVGEIISKLLFLESLAVELHWTLCGQWQSNFYNSGSDMGRSGRCLVDEELLELEQKCEKEN